MKNGWGEISISRFKYPRTYTQHSGGSEFHLQRPGTPASRRRMIYRTPIKIRLSRYNNHKAYPEKIMMRATLREYSAAFPFSINCAGEAPALPGPHLNNVMKLAGNFLIKTVIESLAESFAFVQKLGADPAKFLEILTETMFAAPIYRNYGSMIADLKFYPPGFRLPLGLKDNRLLIAAAERSGVPMPMASLVHDRFIAALAQGRDEFDWASISSISFRDAGL